MRLRRHDDVEVASLSRTLAALARRGVRPETAPRGRYAGVKDPDGRTVVITEAD